MYRFARTYGFLHFSHSDDHDNANDDRKKHERYGTSNGQNLEPGATSSKGSLRLGLPAPSPSLIVPVRLADVATAPLAVAGAAAGAEVMVAGSSTKGATAPVGSRAAAEATACEERLRRYPTSVEEDLRLLRRLRSTACVVPEEGREESEDERGGIRHEDMSKSAVSPATSGAVTAQWVEMCLALRAVEKIALQRELCGRKPPLD